MRWRTNGCPDYRIIAVGVSGAESHEVANALASTTESRGHNPLTSTHFLRGLAFTLAMGGATKGREDEEINIQSCIAFMNTVDKSNNMRKALNAEPVRNWPTGPGAGNGYRQGAGSLQPRPPGREQQRD